MESGVVHAAHTRRHAAHTTTRARNTHDVRESGAAAGRTRARSRSASWYSAQLAGERAESDARLMEIQGQLDGLSAQQRALEEARHVVCDRARVVVTAQSEAVAQDHVA